jgi:hypothetical protein
VAESADVAGLAVPRAGVWQLDILREGRPATLRFRL